MMKPESYAKWCLDQPRKRLKEEQKYLLEAISNIKRTIKLKYLFERKINIELEEIKLQDVRLRLKIAQKCLENKMNILNTQSSV